jgi:hypothetical protein
MSLGGTTSVIRTSSGGASFGGASPGDASPGDTSPGGASKTGLLCGLDPNPSDERSKRRILVRDEATSRLALIDVGNKDNSWDIILDREDGPEDGDPSLSQGRDLQLVGNCRVLIGTHLGYDEYDLLTHQRVAEITSFPGTISAQRLRNRNTLLVGVGTEASPWQSLVGIVFVQVNPSGTVVGTPLVYPGTYVHLVRETAKGTYLIANNQRVIEGALLRNDPDNGYNQVLSTVFTVSNDTQPHAWMGLRITSASGAEETIVSTGDDAKIRIFNADGTLRKTITGGVGQVMGGATGVEPYFFAGLQILPNGNYLVANSSGPVSGNFTKRIPILEYNAAGALVWYWGDPTYSERLSGIHAALVLDGLDPTKLNIEGSDGKLVALE